MLVYAIIVLVCQVCTLAIASTALFLLWNLHMALPFRLGAVARPHAPSWRREILILIHSWLATAWLSIHRTDRRHCVCACWHLQVPILVRGGWAASLQKRSRKRAVRCVSVALRVQGSLWT